MAAPRPPNPLTLNDSKLPDQQFKEYVINWLNGLLAFTVAIDPSAGGDQTTINVASGGAGIRVPNSAGLAVGEVAHYSGGLGLRRASRTGQLATHVCAGVDGAEVILVSASARAPVILDGNGTGEIVYLGINGRGTLERPTSSADNSVWEQILGVRLDNLRAGVVGTALIIPASVPIRV